MTEPSPPLGHNNPPSLTEILRDKYAASALEVEAIATRANDAPRKITSEQTLEAVGGIIKDARALARDIDGKRTHEKAPHLQAGRDVDGFFNAFHDRLTRIADTFQNIADTYAREKAAEERRKREAEEKRLKEEADRQRALADKADERNRPNQAAAHEDKAEMLETRAEQVAAEATAPAQEIVPTQTFGSGLKVAAKGELTFEITDYKTIPLDKLRPYLKRKDVEAAIKSHIKVHGDAEPLAGVRIFENVTAKFR